MLKKVVCLFTEAFYLGPKRCRSYMLWGAVLLWTGVWLGHSSPASASSRKSLDGVPVSIEVVQSLSERQKAYYARKMYRVGTRIRRWFNKKRRRLKRHPNNDGIYRCMTRLWWRSRTLHRKMNIQIVKFQKAKIISRLQKSNEAYMRILQLRRAIEHIEDLAGSCSITIEKEVTRIRRRRAKKRRRWTRRHLRRLRRKARKKRKAYSGGAWKKRKRLAWGSGGLLLGKRTKRKARINMRRIKAKFAFMKKRLEQFKVKKKKRLKRRVRKNNSHPLRRCGSWWYCRRFRSSKKKPLKLSKKK